MYSAADLLAEGFPHSDIRGSTIARISPRLFAACHVLHRLLVPRHPPNALFTLSTSTNARAQGRTATLYFEASVPRPMQPPRGELHATLTLIIPDSPCKRTRPRHPPGRHARLVWKHPTHPSRQAGHGGDRDRTDDPLLAKQVLSQLSYAPKGKKYQREQRACALCQHRAATPSRRRSLLSTSGGFFLCQGQRKNGPGRT
jgi:hypothetical protein